VEGVRVEPSAEFSQLQLSFVDQTQWRYEVIRPLVLFADRTAAQRAQETHTHPDTVRTLRRRFHQQGMPGLLPADIEVVHRRRASPIPEAVRQEIDRLKALYDGFHYRELARILLVKTGHPIADKTVKMLWQQSPVACQGHLGLWDYHRHPDRYQARLQVIQLYYQGWEKVSISRFLHVARLEIHHEPIVSTQGESYLNWMETHFNIQRRLYDYQFSLAHTPAELEQRHQAFLRTYTTTAHQGLLKDRRLPPIPVEVLGPAKGRLYTPEALARHFSQAVFPHITNRYGCVTLHSYHFSVEEGLPQTQVLLWIAGEQLRATFDNVILAEYHCRYDWQDGKVKEIRGGIFYPTRFASSQGRLIPLTPQDCVVVYRTKRPRRQAPSRPRTLQLLLFEVVHAG
jgi:hypothetical protein